MEELTKDSYECVKLAIGLPITDFYIPFPFFISWIQMEKPDTFTVCLPRTPIHEHADSIASIRNDIVQQALEMDCTHLIMMDTDQRYPSNTIPKLLSYNLPIVYAKVHRRYPPFDPILLRGTIGKGEMTAVPEEEWKNNELVEIDGTGSGCALFDLNVFLDIPYPWYRHIKRKGDRPQIGEDMFLCKRLKEAGYKIYSDTKLNITHLSHLEIDENFYDLIQFCNKTQLQKKGE